MDLQTGDRAAADVEALPGGQSGLPEPGAQAGAPAPRPPLSPRADRALAWLALAAAAAIALGLATYAGVKGRGGVADAAHVAAACVVLFALAGFGPTRLLVPVQLWDRLGERQRATLLAHELAHLCRRDHWVRCLELAATVEGAWLWGTGGSVGHFTLRGVR